MLPLQILLVLLSCSQPYEEEIFADDEAGGRRNRPAVGTFYLVNAQTDQDIMVLGSNSEFASSAINIRVEAQAASVKFELTGAETHRQTESSKPFALKGDNSGDYNIWVPKAGDYVLKVTPYSKSGGAGTAGTPVSVAFKVKNSDGSSPISPTNPTPVQPIPGDLFFAGDFQNTTIGTSRRGEPYFTEWDPGLKNIAFFNFQRLESSSTGNAGVIVDENGTKVLKSTLVTRGSKNSRIQYSMDIKSSPANRIYHVSYDMWLHPDMAYLKNIGGSKIVWYSIFEMWLDNVSDSPGARWSIYLDKNPQTGNLCFRWSSELMSPSTVHLQKLIPNQYSTKEVPFGRWFRFEVYWNQDTNQNYIKIDGETHLEFIGKNSYPGYENLGIGWFTPFKHYVGYQVFDWMKNNGKTMEIRYNNFKWYKQ